MTDRVDPFAGIRDAWKSARRRLGSLIEEETKRAALHIELIKMVEPHASSDRVAQVLLQRWSTVAALEGGFTGAAGLFGIPANAVLFTYCQVAVTVSIAQAYNVRLTGRSGEDAVLDVIGRVHGLDGFRRASPRVLGAMAGRLATRRGFRFLGRWVPLLAAPLSARMNQRDLQRTGWEALRRFGRVVLSPGAELASETPRD
ncbi:MAG: hypothetical protein ACFB9M_19915 [Myxococcota bacterium]